MNYKTLNQNELQEINGGSGDIRRAILYLAGAFLGAMIRASEDAPDYKDSPIIGPNTRHYN